MIHLAVLAEEYLEGKIVEIGQFGESYMKSVAPKPSGAAFGKGSHSTGHTKSSIRWSRAGRFTVIIEPDQTYYVGYAEYGRGAERAKNAPYMVFRDGHGRIHRAKYVGPMAGWHFASKTAEAIRAAFGG